MSGLNGVEIHPAAEIFPLLGDAELNALAEDIRQFGQRESCVFYDGKLLDGRNRYRACRLIGIEPEECELTVSDNFDPVAYVVSQNLHRRHLTESQRAMIAARVRKHYEPAAKERQREGGKAAGRGRPKTPGNKVRANWPTPIQRASDDAGAALKVGRRTVDRATTVLTKGSPELIAAVDRGDVPVSRAAKIATELPKSAQVEAAGAPPPRKEKTPFEHLQFWWNKSDAAARARFRLWIEGNAK